MVLLISLLFFFPHYQLVCWSVQGCFSKDFYFTFIGRFCFFKIGAVISVGGFRFLFCLLPVVDFWVFLLCLESFLSSDPVALDGLLGLDWGY